MGRAPSDSIYSEHVALDPRSNGLPLFTRRREKTVFVDLLLRSELTSGLPL